MARAFVEQLERADYAALSFEERLGLLVDREVQDRDNGRLERNLKAARLRTSASIEDLDFHMPRGLDRALIRELASGAWVTAHRNVLVVGPTGVGKTFVACALAHAALRHDHRALSLRVPRLLDELVLARADGRLPRLMAAWARLDVLILDDFGLQPLTAAQAADLLEVIEGPPRAALDDRHQPAPGRSLARGNGRADDRRRDPRSAGPQRLPHRAPR